MSERSITIHVKNGINLARMMAAIFREYEPSIDKISMIGVDLPMDIGGKTPDTPMHLINSPESDYPDGDEG